MQYTPLTQIYSIFVSKDIQAALHSPSTNHSQLDLLLYVIYTSSKEECKKCVIFINADPFLKAVLLLRIRNHTNVICPMVSWFLRTNLFSDQIIPSCICCFANTLKNADRKNQISHPIYRVIREQGDRNTIARFLNNMRNNTEQYYNDCLYLANAMIESPNNIVKNSLFNILMSIPFDAETRRRFTRDIYAHPLLFEWTDRDRMQTIKNILNRRIDPLREELAAKCWHPSRFISWCLDSEEAAEWGTPMGSSPCLTSKRAAWDIHW